jgi:hypothetical protein
VQVVRNLVIMPARGMNVIPQYTPKVCSDPKFSTTLTADFAFDLYQARYRALPFLPRNIRQFLDHHARKPNHSAATDQNSASATVTPDIDDAGRSTSATALQKTVGDSNVEFLLPDRTMEPSSMVTRRTIRQAQDNFYNHDNATLKIDLRNIRKLLNFTTNLPNDEEERPLKRAKIEKDGTECHCNLTIWDGRPGKDREEPGSLVKERSDCTLTIAENGTYGPIVHINLLRPIEVEAHRLKVYVDREGELKKEMIDDYYLEINILPRKQNEEWPPIPILGKSHGDHYAGPDKLPSWALTGALVIKYQGLPKAPNSSTPLKVFFLQDGVLFKTKYGLEVSAEWNRPSAATALKGAPDPFRLGWDRRLSNASSSVPGEDDSGMETRSKQSATLVRRSRQPKFKVTYCFEPPGDRSSTGSSLKKYRTATTTTLACPACGPSFQAKDLDELRFHFVSSHPKYNFILTDTKSTPARVDSAFEITPVNAHKDAGSTGGDLAWERKASRFDVKAYLNGDKSWFGAQKSPVDIKIDEYSQLRRNNNGFLRPEQVRNFRTSKPKRYPIVSLLRTVDNKRTPYTSITHRPISEAEDAMSDSDDEVDDFWLMERHLENLTIVSKQNEWDSVWLEFCRRWDKHRFEEKLEPTRYISDSLVRFLRKEEKWIAQCDGELEQVFRDHLRSLLDAHFINQSVSDDLEKLFNDARRLVALASIIPPMTDTEMAVDTTQQEPPGDREILASLECKNRKELAILRGFFDNLKEHGQPGADTTITEEQYTGLAMVLSIAQPQIRAVLRVWNEPSEPTISGEAVTAPSEIVTKKSPDEQIADWRSQVLLTPSNCCGACSQPIQNRELEALRCSLPKCPTAPVLFHMSCRGLKNSRKRSSWVCNGCRAETRLKRLKEEKAPVGSQSKEQKFKGRAIDPQPSAQPAAERHPHNSRAQRTPHKTHAQDSTSAANAGNAISPDTKESHSTRLDRRTGNSLFIEPTFGSSPPSSQDQGQGKAVTADEDEDMGNSNASGRNCGLAVFR